MQNDCSAKETSAGVSFIREIKEKENVSNFDLQKKLEAMSQQLREAREKLYGNRYSNMG